MKSKLAVLSFILLVAIAGCNKQSAEKPKVDELRQVGKYGGRLTLATLSDPKSFNMIIAQETSTTNALAYLFEGLTDTDGVTAEVRPKLAESWTHSEDGKVWDFKLREDVLWFDGERFTADDVVFTFNKLVYNPAVPNSARDVLTIEGQAIKVEKLDDFRVRFTLPKPFAPFLRYVGESILPQHILAESVKAGKFTSTWGVDTPPEQLIGTGPYKLVEYKSGQRLVYRRNLSYWQLNEEGERLPYIEEIVVLIVPSLETHPIKFLNREIDAFSMRGEDYMTLQPKEAQENFTIYDAGPATGTLFLAFNQNPDHLARAKYKWFTDLNFRRAMAHAMDKQSMIDNIAFGQGYPQHSAASVANKIFHNPNVRKYEYDLEKSKAYLRKAEMIDRDGDGVREDRDGNPVRFMLLTNSGNTVRQDLGVMIKDDLAKLGVQVDFKPIDFNVLVTHLNSSFDWQAMIIGFTGGVEPHGGKNLWHSSGSLHLWHPLQKSPATVWEAEIDELFERGAQELDQEKRQQIYYRWQEVVAEQLPVIYTINQASLYAVRDRFVNLQPTAYGGIFHNIEEIYIK